MNKYMSRNRSTTVKKYSKLLKEDRDWDWAYMLELEQFKLKRMSKYFAESQLVHGWEQMVSEINLCIKLIDIIMERDPKGYFFNLTGKLPYVNSRNWKRFVSRHPEPINDYYLDDLRQAKALHLYNLIRTYRMRSWWD